jgi:hypothetical protein
LELVEVGIATAAPILNVGVLLENVDTGDRFERRGEVTEGLAKLVLSPVPAGLYRISADIWTVPVSSPYTISSSSPTTPPLSRSSTPNQTDLQLGVQPRNFITVIRGVSPQSVAARAVIK